MSVKKLLISKLREKGPEIENKNLWTEANRKNKERGYFKEKGVESNI